MGASERALGWAAGQPAVAHVFVDELLDRCRIEGADGHHLARVRRLRTGELVTAADGSGAWRTYVVDAVEQSSVRLAAAGESRVEPATVPALAVAFALTKADKPERVVQQLTELGVDRIVPVFAERSVIRWSDAKIAAAPERFRRVAREAAQQARRARLPVVEAPTGLAALRGHPAVILADRGAPGAPLPLPPRGEWLLVVGPEGGFAPGETDPLAPIGRLAVGPHVLRAETAAIAAASLLTAERHSGLR